MPENEIVGRDLELAHETAKRWHVAHVSTAASLERIRVARDAGVAVTCEVTPHHLLLTDAAVIGAIREQPAATVLGATGYGGTRVIDMLVGDPLPRIC